MQDAISLLSYLNDVRKHFAVLTEESVRLFSDENAAWISGSKTEAGEPLLSRYGLRHAAALTMLYANVPVVTIRALDIRLEKTPRNSALWLVDLILGLTYSEVGYRPDASEWKRNRLLQNLSLKVGHQFVTECLHAWAREYANRPERRAKRGGAYVYSCYMREEGQPFEQGSLLDDHLAEGESVAMTSSPEIFMAAHRGFASLEDDARLGRAVIELAHYASIRQYKKEELAEVIRLIADFES